MGLSYFPFARRYRPARFKEVLGQEAIVRTLMHALQRNTVASAYLFSGGRGAGKTTLARLLAKAINCEALQDKEPCQTCSSCVQITNGSNVDVIEIDGASHRGIDEIRQIKETVGFQPSVNKTKIYIIDEVHMLTKEAFNALLKILEEPPERVKFFFATTEPHRIPATILSRCQHFTLKRPTLELIVTKLRYIVEQEKIQIPDQVLYRIAQRADGALRDAETLLDQLISFQGKQVEEGAALEMLGIPNVELFLTIDRAIFEGKEAVALQVGEHLFQEGYDLLAFVEEFIVHLRTLLALKFKEKDAAFSVMPKELQQTYLVHSEKYHLPHLTRSLEYLQEKKGELKGGFAPQIALEVLLLHLIRSSRERSLDEIVAQLQQLQECLAGEAAPLPPSVPSKTTQEEPSATSPPPLSPMSPTQRVEQREETVMRFAAVTLEGTLKRQTIG